MIGDSCFCMCFYEMSFKISKVMEIPKVILGDQKQYLNHGGH